MTIGFLNAFHWEQLYNTQLIQGSYDVIDRTPAWRVNQSRLMGPSILKIMTLAGISKWWSMRLFTIFFVLINNFLFAKCISILSDSKYHILNSLLVLNAFFIISQDVWLFVWDFIDVTFFILYGFIILKKDFIKFLPFINFLHIFNRETALIMASFFIIRLFLEKNKNIKHLIKDRLFYWLSFNFLFGVIYTYFSRKILFIKQSELTGGGQDLNNNFLGGNWITPSLNYSTLFNGETVSNFIILFSVFLVVITIIRKYNTFNTPEKYLALSTLLNIVPVFLFGIFIETRQYFPSLVTLTYLIFSVYNSNSVKE
tara:strand:+ start:169 stop:1107 length:939 start_codon:yes stop_codon:yes gene_type:complete